MVARGWKIALALALVAGAAPSASTQEALPFPFTVEGEWWFQMQGGKGMARIDFGSIAFGQAEVRGAGFSREFQTAWVISDEDSENRVDNQTVQFTSDRQIVGTLTLQDPDRNGDIGTLTITGGTLSATKNDLKLRGTISFEQNEGAKPGALRMKAIRVPDLAPDLQGRSTDFHVRGSGVRSDKYDLSLVNNPELGFPFLDLISGGPVRADGIERPGVIVTGLAGVDPRGRVFSEVETHFASAFDLGDGFGIGKIVQPAVEGLRPKLKLRTSTTQRRRLNYSGVLLEIVGIDVPEGDE